MLERFEGEWTGLGVPEGAGVVAGVSGGVDSVVLLRCLLALREKGTVGMLHAAHLDHGIRGEAAREDARFVEELAAKWGVPCTVAHADVPALAAEKGIGLEEAAREARYGFLEKVRQELGADYIAVAHHGDDQAETVLLHLIRGTGLTGLTGMRGRNGNLLRPMLAFTRAEIEAFAKEHDLPFRTDETNAEPDCIRNRIRLQLLPTLAADYNPAIGAGLCRTAALCARDEDYMEEQAARALEAARLPGGGYSRKALASLHPALQARAARGILRAHGALYDAGEAMVSRLTALFTARTGAKLPLNDGLWAWTAYDALHVGLPPEETGFSVPFIADGITEVPGGRFVSGFVSERREEGPNVGWMDYDRLPDGLVVRTRQPGDRFHPLGAPGSRKLKEFFIDRKAPREDRMVPMLTAGDRALFLPGFTIADDVKITGETRRILRVAFEKEKSY